MKNRIMLARQAGAVERFHTQPLLMRENVATHTFNLINLLLIMNPDMPCRIIRAALVHDMGEYAVGDIPAPVKKLMPEDVITKIQEMEDKAVENIHPRLSYLLDKDDVLVLKIADRADGLLKCCEELSLGNKNVIPIGNRYVGYLYTLTATKSLYPEFVGTVIDMWHREVQNEC